MSERLQAYQVEALHREKLVTLGTLAAGLMHELHNPGSAAASAPPRSCGRTCCACRSWDCASASGPRPRNSWIACRALLQHAVSSCRLAAMSSVDQADAEEELSQWLGAAGVENAWTIGPALVEMGFQPEELRCAQEYFDPAGFSDALNWLGCAGVEHVAGIAVEDSIGRISELVMAVKKFAYDEKSPAKRARRARQPAEHADDPGPQAADQADQGGEAFRCVAVDD